VAVTLKKPVCPAVTVWFAGCVVIVEAAGAELLDPTPAHPTDATASPKIKVTTPRRFIVYSLSCDKFPGAELELAEG
jgi:hypothetical protein